MSPLAKAYVARTAGVFQPRQSNVDAVTMINVTPPKESYWGFPFGIVGIYIDTCAGTGIKTK